MTQTLLTHIRSVLALDGLLPSKELFFHLRSYPLIAADGAGKELLKMGLVPKLILGDLDSLKETTIQGSEIIKREDQNKTDFEKTMEELEARSLLPTFIVGVSGKELDHTLYNLQVIRRFSKEYKLPFLVTDDRRRNKMGIICHNHFHHTLAPDTLISLLPFPRATVSTKGLVWDVHKAKLSQEGSASIRNRVRDPFISIKVHSGALLILFDT